MTNKHIQNSLTYSNGISALKTLMFVLTRKFNITLKDTTENFHREILYTLK